MKHLATLVLVCIASLPITHTLSAADPVDLASVTMVTLGNLVREGDTQQVQRIQSELGYRLQTSMRGAEIRQTCLTLSAAPNDAAILILVSRLQQAEVKNEQFTAALCRGLGDLLGARLPVSNVTQPAAAQVLANLVEAPDAGPVVVQAAMLAIARMRAPGLDLLLELRKRREKAVDGFFTSLADTKDLRALPVLRSAFADAAVTSGQRIEILHAIGQLFLSSRRAQLPIPAAEEAACASLVYSVLAEPSILDQTWSVAIRALSQITPHDPRVRALVRASLTAPSHVQREGALQALYLDTTDPDAQTMEVVRALAESDGVSDVRDLARSVLCKNDVEACSDVQ